ncbi:MAG: tRNA (adenosine(37)-N6)-threonylcarbamoyltransferase complex dimerization subunit type 1 TsaB [Alphaproteobacteria bacterium]|nr:tRNA (adenosine(37)-N6)-threonylcarbamoyltransferase complex dimerization subunit type 1 TsaB [Alphaproteobacteria bacterium]
MNILAIDCTHSICSAAFFNGEKIVSEIVEKMERGQAERLIPMVQDVLMKAKQSFKEIDAIAVTTGPGSFTGVRVGLAAADGIALAAGLPMIGVSVLDVLAWKINRLQPDIKKVCLVLETKRDDFYAQCFESGKPEAEPAVVSADKLAGLNGYVFAGNAADRLKETITKISVLNISMPTAAEIALFCAQKTPQKEYPEPLYLREAEVTLCRK